MYAVVTTGGKQYRVEAGSTLLVEKLVGEPGSSVTLDRVLLIGDGEAVTVGTPTVDGASVRATVVGEELGPKIVIFKFKQKVKYRRRTGHRQHLTRLHIDAISADGKTVTAEAPVKAPKPARTAKPKAASRRRRPPQRRHRPPPRRPRRSRRAGRGPAQRPRPATADDGRRRPRSRRRLPPRRSHAPAPGRHRPRRRASEGCRGEAEAAARTRAKAAPAKEE